MKVLTGKEYGELFSEPVDDDCLSYPVNMTEASDIILPNRTQKSHKYSYGRALDRKSTRLNSSHPTTSRMPSSA